MNISEIKELIQLINETKIGELELENGEFKLVLRKGGFLTQEVQSQTIPYAVPSPQTFPVTDPQIADFDRTTAEGGVQKGIPLNSPMVGTFYRAPGPDAEPFVKIGDRIKVGQTICIIEAMKLMNEIEAEFAGKVVDILVKDGQPVEYGETLFIIDPDK